MPRLGLFLLLSLAVTAGHAQTAVHHCVSADGTAVFTDQPCQSVQAARIGTTRAHPYQACPASREALRQRVGAAFATRDINALAGLMLWQGYGSAEAVREMVHMQRLMRRSLLEVIDNDVTPPANESTVWPAAAVDMPATNVETSNELEVHLGGVQMQASGLLRFSVEVRAGCFWLHP